MILRGKVILSCIKKRRLLSESHASTNPLKQKSLDLRKVFILKNITSHGQNHAQIRPLELTASIFGQVWRRKVASRNHVELKKSWFTQRKSCKKQSRKTQRLRFTLSILLFSELFADFVGQASRKSMKNHEKIKIERSNRDF